jgi:hypothetical protein
MQEEANLLMISGCFHQVKSLQEKYHIAEDLKRWYVFGRTSTVVKLSCEEVFCTGDLVLSSAGGSWFGAGGIVYFCPELLLMMAISKYIVSK